MKTIEEAAAIYTDENPFGNITWNGTSEIDRLKEKKYQGFIAGVEFAQRWISVEDELPEEPTFLIAKKLNGLVLGLFYNANKDFMYGEIIQTPQVTHWRPIELK